MKKLMRVVFWLLAAAGGTVVAVVAMTNAMVAFGARGRCYSSLEAIPARKVGLVLGTSKYIARGRENLHFRYRMDAAARLFKAHKVQYLIVSGDNASRRYNEPVVMQNDLIARGIPADRIYLDYAGFRTLDSVVRAERIFGERSFTVISQKWHNERAIYIAEARGLDAIGFNASDVPGPESFRSRLRECLARVLAVLDLKVLDRQPRFLGPAVEVGPPRREDSLPLDDMNSRGHSGPSTFVPLKT